MNFLDEQFAIFHQRSLPEKMNFFKREGRLFDVVYAQQFDRALLDMVYKITNSLRQIAKTKEGLIYLQTILGHKRAMLYFNQPSSRTFLSFQNACYLLGMKTSEIRDPTISSEVKGESMDDSLRTFSSYTDLLIIRSQAQNVSARASWLLNTFSKRPVPVMNGGSGSDQHPTQGILDIYTLQRSFEEQGGLDGKTIVLCGDLKRGRTARSLSDLLKNFNDIKLIFTAPKNFQMREDILASLDQHQVSYKLETENLRNVLAEADAIYMTRIQDEHDTFSGESGLIDTSKFKLKMDDLPLLKKNTAILHPFPRRDEIDVQIDSDPRAKYWRQERNGMWTRTALIAYIFNVHLEILDYYQAEKSYE